MNVVQEEINYDIENRRIKEYHYVNKKSGEFTKLTKDDVLYGYENRGLFSKFNYHKSQETFIMVPCIQFQKNLKDYFKMNYKDLGMLLYLMTFSRYRKLSIKENEEVCHFSIRNRSQFLKNNRDLKEILKENDNIIKKFKKKLKDNGILYEDEKGYYIKKSRLIKGKIYGIEKKTGYHKISIEYIQAIVKEFRNKKMDNYYHAIGFLFSLLPYINISYGNGDGMEVKPSYNRLVNKDYSYEKGYYLPISKAELAKTMKVSLKTIYNQVNILNSITRSIYNESLIFEGEIYHDKSHEKKIVSWFINSKFTFTNDKSSFEYRALVDLAKNSKNIQEVVNESK